MVLGGKVVAAVKPDVAVELNFFEEEGSEEELRDDCICICFCEDEDENDDDNEESAIFGSQLLKEDQENPGVSDGEEEEEEEEEGLVDPNDVLKSECSQKHECSSLKDKLNECNARVESRSKTAETCVEELIDFMHCVDHCASKTLFSKLK